MKHGKYWLDRYYNNCNFSGHTFWKRKGIKSFKKGLSDDSTSKEDNNNNSNDTNSDNK